MLKVATIHRFNGKVERSQNILRIIKTPNIYQTCWKTLAFMFISYVRELIAQKLDDNRIDVLYAKVFGRPTSEASVLEQIRYLASIERVLVWIRSV